jgi:hypothetical protein
MKGTGIALFFLALALIAAEKKPYQGHAENESASLTATIQTAEQVRAAFASDFDNHFTVVEVHLTPKGGKPVDVRLDDFILRSSTDGDHSGPLAAAQVSSGGALIVNQTFAPRSNAEMPKMVAGSKVEMKEGQENSDQLSALKKRILPEKEISEPVSGMLFFPLERQKPKSLSLLYTTATGKLRVEFRQ